MSALPGDGLAKKISSSRSKMDSSAGSSAERSLSTFAVEQRDERLGAAMIAHALMHDATAVALLAREHDDPARLAAAVARAAYGVLAMTALRPNQSNLFDLTEPYGYAQWLAKDGAEDG
jgi:hypothetical protein